MSNLNLDTTNTILKGIQSSLTAIMTTLGKVFPQGEAVTSTSSGASGKFLTIIGPDGNTYKVPLNNP